MSTQPQAVPANQVHLEHRLVVRGKLISTQPLANIKVIEKESGQTADVDIAVSYSFRNLARAEEEQETSYTLFVCINDTTVMETSITIPAADARTNRSYDLDLDQLPGKVQPPVAQPIQPQPTTTGATPTKPTRTRAKQSDATKSK